MKKLLITLGLAIGIYYVNAQQITNTAGGDATGSGGSLSYSVGQVAYMGTYGDPGSVIPGVQQAVEISILSGIEDALGINLQATVFPNPTSDVLTLEIKDFQHQGLIYSLYDMQGKLLEKKSFTGNSLTIDLKKLISSQYFLSVFQDNKAIKTFKIVKN